MALWTRAAGSYRAGHTRDAAVGLVCGALDPAAWLAWWFFGRTVAPGLAIPEFVGVLGLQAWALYTVFSTRGWQIDGRERATGEDGLILSDRSP